MSYGFSIQADENVIQTLNRIQKSMDALTAKIESQTKDIQKSFREMGETTKEVGRWLGEAFAIREVYQFGKELMHVTAEFEAFQNVIKYSSRSVIDSQDNIDYLEGAIRRLHMPMREAYQGFSEMQAGLIGTGIEGERLRKLFEGISTASTVLHLPTHALEMTLYDFKEIGERGLNMRNMRSLMGWLPGISEIVKETFHKTFQELEQEHMSGPDFLNKLAGGLQKHFAPGLANAGNSLQSQINDTVTAFTRMERELGDRLEPLFKEILTDIRAAFNSGIVQTFIKNIQPIVRIIITAVKMWVEYKTVMMAINIIEEASIAIKSALAVAQGKLSIATKEGTVSLEEFKAGLEGLGRSFMALGIGAAIELFYKLRKSIDDAKASYEAFIEEKTGQNSLQQSILPFNDDISKFQGAMADTTLMKDKRYKDDLLNRGSNLIKDMQQNVAENIKPVMDSAAINVQRVLVDTFADGKTIMPIEDIKRLQSGVRADSSTYNQAQQQIASMKALTDTLKKKGAHMPDYAATLGDNITGGALQTVGLAGAQGGLGQAKIINIHVDTMQKVAVGVPEGLKRAGQDAVEVMLRTLNNIAYGQSATQ